jgi:hypothetical protein
MITLTLGGEGYLNFMGNEFGHPGAAQDLLFELRPHIHAVLLMSLFPWGPKGCARVARQPVKI